MDLQTLFWNAEINDLSKGYLFHEKNQSYICLICGETFEQDIIYPVGEQFYNAKKMTEHHITKDHGGMFTHLINLNKSYTSLSDNQKSVLALMHDGMSDQEIAKELSLSGSTIRNYRFKFKEKEKQAKAFLAIMDSLNQRTDVSENMFITPHEGATQLDDRYNITEKDRIKTISYYLDSVGHLKEFPRKEKKKIILLTEIAKNFKQKRTYSEYEINTILKRIYSDHVLIRRYLIQYGFLDRHTDGRSYWVK